MRAPPIRWRRMVELDRSSRASLGSETVASRPAAVAQRPVDPRVIPLLDLLADLIAHHLVANPVVPGQQDPSETSPREEPAVPSGGQPGIPGPSPIVPADSHETSHPSPAEPHRRTRRRAKGDKEPPHASD
jgi:hypothetical protein